MLASDYTVVTSTCFFNKKNLHTPTSYDISSPHLVFIKSTSNTPYNNTICALTHAYTSLSSVIFETHTRDLH